MKPEVKEEQKALTLEEAKEQIAKVRGFKSYDEARFDASAHGIDVIMTEAAELYAQSRVDAMQREIEKRISEVDVPHGVQQRPLGRIDGLKEALGIIKQHEA